MRLPEKRPVLPARDEPRPHGIFPHIVPLLRIRFPASQHMIEEPLLPMRTLHAVRPQHLRQRILERLHPARQRDLPIIERDEGVQVIRHQHISTEPRPALRPNLRKALQRLLHARIGENVRPVLCACRHKINRMPGKDRLEPLQTLLHSKKRSSPNVL